MKELLDRLLALETWRREIEEELEGVRAEIAEVNARVVEAFADAGVQNVKLEGGVTVALRTDIRANIPADLKLTALDVFEEHEPDVVKAQIHPKTLESWVRAHVDEETGEVVLPDWARDIVNVHQITRATVLGLKTK